MSVLMQLNVFPFEYNFNKTKLLEEYHNRNRKGLGYRYLAGESYEDRIEDETKANYSKTTVIRLKSGFAYNTAKNFVSLFGDYQFKCHFIGYGKEDFVEWHVDKRPEEYCVNASRVNIFLTGKSYTTFRDGNYWYDQAVVNVMGAEHCYDNRGLDKRVMFQIAIKGISHDELCENILQNPL
jgi:hypothetical protein